MTKEEKTYYITDIPKIKKDYQENKIEFMVHGRVARKIVDSQRMPKNYRYAYRFWIMVAFFLILGSIVVLFFKLWLLAIGLLVVEITVNQANGKSACQHLLQHSLEDDNFLLFTINTKALVPVDKKIVDIAHKSGVI